MVKKDKFRLIQPKDIRRKPGYNRITNMNKEDVTMKKLTALLLTLALLLSALPAFAESEGKWDGPVEQIIMTWLTGGVDNPYLDKAAEKINEITREKIGVEVSFRQESVFTAASSYTRWLGNREELDIMVIAFAPMAPFISMGMLEPLDDYLQYAPHVQAYAEQGVAIYDPNATGHVYGLSVIGRPMAGAAGAVYLFEEDLKAAGFDYQYNDQITMAELDEIARKIAPLYENGYVGLVGSAPKSDLMYAVDSLGTAVSSGVLMGVDSTTVVDFFETEEYQEYLQIVRGWYNDGLLKKDSATIDINDMGTVGNDPEHCFMMLNNSDMGLVKNYSGMAEEATGKHVIELLTTPIFNKATSSIGSFMTIPFTSKHPEAAMRFMDLLYYDKEVSDILYCGIEGENFIYLDEEHLGAMPITEAYYVALGLYGYNGLCAVVGPYDAELYARYDAWEATGASNPTKGFGFCYQPDDNMTMLITAIDAVMAEYRAALETGSADVDKVYPEFIAKLKANGIDQVIADKQAQFNTWLAGK